MKAQNWLVPVVLALVWGGTLGCGKLLGERYNSTGYTTVRFGAGSPNPLAAGITFIESQLDFATHVRPSTFTSPTAGAAIFATNYEDSSKVGRFVIPASSFSAGNYGTLTIPNGRYKFAMLGYSVGVMSSGLVTGLGQVQGGAAGDVIHLDGSPRTIHFAGEGVTHADRFRESGSLSNVKLVICGVAVGGKSIGTDCASAEAPTAPVVRARLLVLGRNEFNGAVSDGFTNSTASEIQSGCLDISAGNHSTALPFFGGNPAYSDTKLRAEVFLYSDTSCSTLHSYYVFNNGLSGATTSAAGNGVMGGLAGSSAADAGTRALWGYSASSGYLYIQHF